MIVMVDNDEINRKRIWIFFLFQFFYTMVEIKKVAKSCLFFRHTVTKWIFAAVAKDENGAYGQSIFQMTMTLISIMKFIHYDLSEETVRFDLFHYRLTCFKILQK